jgi:hypothetical protein
MPRKTYAPELIGEVQRLTADGRSIRQINRRLQVPRSTVSAILRDFKLPNGNPDCVQGDATSWTNGDGASCEPPTRLLLHPLINPLRPLPDDLDVHPTARALYDDALAADRASEIDILIVAFDLPLPRCRAYLNVLAAERLRNKFDLTDGESAASPRPTMPLAIWSAAYFRLQLAFEQQEEEHRTAVERLIAALPRDVPPDA